MKETYIFSPDKVIIKEASIRAEICESRHILELGCYDIYSMSLLDKQLLVASWRSNKIHLYKIYHKQLLRTKTFLTIGKVHDAVLTSTGDIAYTQWKDSNVKVMSIDGVIKCETQMKSPACFSVDQDTIY